MHAKTAIHIAELIVPGVRFSQQQHGSLTLVEVHGIGHEAGKAIAAAAPAPVAAPVAAATAANEEIFQLPAGALSKAAPEMLRDFRTDLGHIRGATSAEITPNLPGDHLVIRGSPEQRVAAQTELKKVTHFYFGGGG